MFTILALYLINLAAWLNFFGISINNLIACSFLFFYRVPELLILILCFIGIIFIAKLLYHFLRHIIITNITYYDTLPRFRVRWRLLRLRWHRKSRKQRVYWWFKVLVCMLVWFHWMRLGNIVILYLVICPAFFFFG